MEEEKYDKKNIKLKDIKLLRIRYNETKLIRIEVVDVKKKWGVGFGNQVVVVVKWLWKCLMATMAFWHFCKLHIAKAVSIPKVNPFHLVPAWHSNKNEHDFTSGLIDCLFDLLVWWKLD